MGGISNAMACMHGMFIGGDGPSNDAARKSTFSQHHLHTASLW